MCIRDRHNALTSRRTLSPFASATAKAANVPLTPPAAFQSHFLRQDVLEWKSQMGAEDNQNLFAEPSLVTIMFTLNELYTASLSKTQNLLLNITANVQIGTLMLVVDSPGSYSTVTINNKEKKYPMSWLLDHTLLETAPRLLSHTFQVDDNSGEVSTTSVEDDKQYSGHFKDPPAVWEKVVSDESRWFRLPTGLRYPLELENMRYQIHLYRRL